MDPGDLDKILPGDEVYMAYTSAAKGGYAAIRRTRVAEVLQPAGLVRLTSGPGDIYHPSSIHLTLDEARDHLRAVVGRYITRWTDILAAIDTMDAR